MKEEIDRDTIIEAKRVDLVEIVGRVVKLKRQGGAYWGCCPFHTERTPSFKVDPKGFFICFGCGKRGDAITWTKDFENLTFMDAVKKLSGRQFTGTKTISRFCGVQIHPNHDRRRDENATKARAIWAKAIPLAGTHGHDYLRARGVRLPPSPELRFFPSLPESVTGRSYPALIARLSDDRDSRCIQRIYLDPEKPIKAALEAPKRTLGPMDGAAVRFRMPTQGFLGLAEGVETALSAMQIYAIPVWAMAGTRYTAIRIPPDVKVLTLFADPGEAGEQAAYRGQQFWEETRGINCEVILPAAHFDAGPEADFNDVLRGRQ